MYLFDADGSRKLDSAFSKAGTPDVLLMMRAAYSIWSKITKFEKRGKIWCFSGPGNNGGDAYGVAALALMAGRKVSLFQEGVLSNAAQTVSSFASKLGVEILNDLPSLNLITNDDIIVDGLLGTGLNRPPAGKCLAIIEWINMCAKQGALVISIDVPSGLDATTGLVQSVCVKADYTIMCLSAKQGCYTGMGPEVCGDLSFADLGCSQPERFSEPSSILLGEHNRGEIFRSKVGHKGTFGNVLVLGGWPRMQGAGCLAGLAALRAGAGKVYICGPEFPDTAMELISVERDLKHFEDILSKVDAVVAGPGLGANSEEFLELVWESDIPLVLDADGLNWLAMTKPRLRKESWIGTPHPGEAKTLIGSKCENRFDTLHELQSKYGGEWVLKGAGTLIGPVPIYINPFADDILATAGSGDVLAGTIGGLLAQRADCASLKGVWMHSRAGEILRAECKGSIVASDLLDKLSEAFYELTNYYHRRHT